MGEAYDPLSYVNLAESVVRALLSQEPGPLPPVAPFPGAGVYALYYTGDFPPYQKIVSSECTQPVYVGKADPPGGRTGSVVVSTSGHRKLYQRLKEHGRSIDEAANLHLAHFRCRYLVVEPVWIRLAEQFLVAHYQPIWNCVVDGFGSHVPGRGRPGTRSSAWDVLHPRKSRDIHGDVEAQRAEIIAAIDEFLSTRVHKYNDVSYLDE